MKEELFEQVAESIPKFLVMLVERHKCVKAIQYVKHWSTEDSTELCLTARF